MDLVKTVKGKSTTTSLIIAEKFEKRHDDILKAIKNLECPEEFSLRNFAESEYTNTRGRKYPCYTITRDGFSFLAMGFTGKKAAEWKVKFLEAFNAMEKALTQPEPVNQFDLMISQAKALKGLSQKQIALDGRQYDIEERQDSWETWKEDLEERMGDLTAKEGQKTVREYAREVGRKLTNGEVSKLGKKCTRRALEDGHDQFNVASTKARRVNIYPIEVLEEIFEEELY